VQAKESNFFKTYLHGKFEQITMSIRKLVHACQYDPATISHLANGKQKLEPDHLVKIGKILQIPVIELWYAAGYIKNERPEEESTSSSGTDE
jgi:hypothetical protein